jgi:dTDP-4-amino-4,6-dideoxygalactose transaminase
MNDPKPRSVPFTDLALQHRRLRPELDAIFDRLLGSSQFILGEEVASFERAFADYCGADQAIGCGNGTDALELALAALGIGRGDEVITVSYTFTGTGEAIVRSGAEPRFVDVDPGSLLMTVDNVAAVITDRTRAVIAVDIYGSVVDIQPLVKLAEQHSLAVIEDAAQAHGATRDGRRSGSWADVSTFSFYPGKNLGAIGDAGAVVTSDSTLAEAVRLLRDHGRTTKYEHRLIGRNSRLDGLQGAVLRLKLDHLDAWNERRRQVVAAYREGIAGLRGISPLVAAHTGSAEHLFVVRVQRRQEWVERLSARGIDTGIHYPIPLHLQEAYQRFPGADVHLPVTEAACDEVLSLPLFPEITDAQVHTVIDAIGAIAGELAKAGATP